jgi:hypothetical protein
MLELNPQELMEGDIQNDVSSAWFLKLFSVEEIWPTNWGVHMHYAKALVPAGPENYQAWKVSWFPPIQPNSPTT